MNAQTGTQHCLITKIALSACCYDGCVHSCGETSFHSGHLLIKDQKAKQTGTKHSGTDSKLSMPLQRTNETRDKMEKRDT